MSKITPHNSGKCHAVLITKEKFVFLTEPSNKTKHIFLSRTAFTAERYRQG